MQTLQQCPSKLIKYNLRPSLTPALFDSSLRPRLPHIVVEAGWKKSFIEHDKSSKFKIASQFLSASSNSYRYICIQQMELMEYDISGLVF